MAEILRRLEASYVADGQHPRPLARQIHQLNRLVLNLELSSPCEPRWRKLWPSQRSRHVLEIEEPNIVRRGK